MTNEEKYMFTERVSQACIFSMFGAFFSMLLIGIDIFEKLMYILLIFSGICLVLVIISEIRWRNIPLEIPLERKCFRFGYNNFEELKTFFEERMEQKLYKNKKSRLKESVGTVTMYAEEYVFGDFRCYALIRTEELTEQTHEKINDIIHEILQEYLNEKRFGRMELTKIVCVDRKTPELQSYVDSIGGNSRILRVGIALDEKKAYISEAKQKFIYDYIKERGRNFAAMMKFEEEKYSE